MSAMIVDFIAAAAVDRFDEPHLLTPVLPCDVTTFIARCHTDSWPTVDSNFG